MCLVAQGDQRVLVCGGAVDVDVSGVGGLQSGGRVAVVRGGALQRGGDQVGIVAGHLLLVDRIRGVLGGLGAGDGAGGPVDLVAVRLGGAARVLPRRLGRVDPGGRVFAGTVHLGDPGDELQEFVLEEGEGVRRRAVVGTYP